jgi:hypothetical protein
MLKLKLAAISIGFFMLSAAATFAQQSSTPSNPVPSQSTASGSGNSASVGTESNTDQPDLATKRAAARAKHPPEQNPPEKTTTTQNAGPTTTSSGTQTPGHSKFPGSGP